MQVTLKTWSVCVTDEAEKASVIIFCFFFSWVSDQSRGDLAWLAWCLWFFCSFVIRLLGSTTATVVSRAASAVVEVKSVNKWPCFVIIVLDMCLFLIYDN